MAGENDILIKFVVDDKQLTSAEDKLVQLGKVAKNDADEFKKLNAEFSKTAKVSGDAGKGISGLAKDAKSANNDLGRVKDTINNIGMALGVAFSVQAVLAFGKAAVGEFLRAEEASKKLEFAVKNVGKEGSATFARLKKQAEDLESAFGADADAIKDLQGQFLALGLSGKQIEALIPKVLNLASATGKDLRQAGELVIQGINGQVRGLKELGLEFENTNTRGGNYAILLEKLNKFQGASAELAETNAGKIARLQKTWENFLESIGAGLVDSSDFIAAALNGPTGIAQYLTDRAMNRQKELVNERESGVIAKLQAMTDKELEIHIAYMQNLVDRTDKNDKKLLAMRQRYTELALGILMKRTELEKQIEQKGAGEREKIVIDSIAMIDLAHSRELLSITDRQIELLDIYANLVAKNYAALRKMAQDVKKDMDELQPKGRPEPNKVPNTWDQQLESMQEFTKRLQDYGDASEEILVGVADVSSAVADRRIQDAERQRDAGIITEEQYAEKVRKIKERAARQDKAMATFVALINAYQAFNTALSNPPGPPSTIPIAAAALASGLLQVAAIQARPIPKFKHGTLSVPGIDMGGDSVMAMLQPQEAVIPKKTNLAYASTIAAVYNNQIPPAILNGFVGAYLKGGKADNTELIRAMKQSKGVKIENAKLLANLIGDRIASTYNPRRII